MDSEPEIDGIIAFMERFPTEESCVDYLVKNVFGGKLSCPYCNHDKVHKLDSAKKYRCSKCKVRFNVTTKTYFGSSKVSLRKWFIAIFLISTRKKGYSSIQLAKDLKISQKAAWNLGIKIRALLTECRDMSPLTGIVEMDEAYVGRKKRPEPGKRRKRGKGTTKVPIVGMVERGGRVIAIPSKKVDGNAVTSIAKKYIDPEAFVMTDDATYYNNFKNEFATHSTVCHSDKTSPTRWANGIVNTNTMEGFWSQLKLSLLITHHSVSDKYMDLYCNEFTHRYSTRHQRNIDRFNEVMQHTYLKRLTREDIKNRQPGFHTG